MTPGKRLDTPENPENAPARVASAKTERLGGQPIVFGEPLVRHIFTADPSAHVFDGRLYIYPSHDIDTGVPATDEGDHFGMVDYHVLSFEDFAGPVVDRGEERERVEVGADGDRPSKDWRRATVWLPSRQGSVRQTRAG